MKPRGEREGSTCTSSCPCRLFTPTPPSPVRSCCPCISPMSAPASAADANPEPSNPASIPPGGSGALPSAEGGVGWVRGAAWAPSFGCRVPGPGFQVSHFRIRDSDFGLNCAVLVDGTAGCVAGEGGLISTNPARLEGGLAQPRKSVGHKSDARTCNESEGAEKEDKCGSD